MKRPADPYPEYSVFERLDGLGTPIRPAPPRERRVITAVHLAAILSLLAIAVAAVRLVRDITTLDGSLLLSMSLIFAAAIVLLLSDPIPSDHLDSKEHE
ncbi:hypothetical protein [Cryobacterium psychrophilum]|uniref:Uncharacterized protein n=1 Tax=Cryobacterium psychrophilum TaxID=41988 RepID=A0A4Y8KRH3_9MICO|nr:hypothetical protein [Cryobacterium psychrophilum]TFD80849.1 hypothetical protein E3T53_04290 [Cryobacterium psychrophilum]